MARDYASHLSALQSHQSSNPLSILTLSEPLLNPPVQHHASGARESDPSSLSHSTSSEQDVLTPHSLTLDLSHYRDLFSKLRFSYLEQVTKEKYLKSIVGDPPVLVSREENDALEARLVGMKAELKGKKEGVDALVGEMETLARDLARRHEVVEEGRERLSVLPEEVRGLEEEVRVLREQVVQKRGMEDEGSEDPRMRLGVDETRRELEEQRRRLREVDEEVERLQRVLPGKIRECEKVERELVGLEARRDSSTRAAREVMRLREEGGRDLVEEQGRWLRSEEIVLRGLLGVEAA